MAIESAPQSVYETLTQLTNRFFWYLDEFRYDELVELMHQDASWHRQGKLLRGRSHMLADLTERPRTQRIRHVVTNGFIDRIEGDTAHFIAYMIGYRADEGVAKPAPQTIDGPLRMLLIKSRFERRDGRWLFAEQIAAPEFEFRAPAR
jgi:hypothetical protein